MGAVSATGATIHPAIVVEGKTAKGSWMEAYPEALWGWDKAGYFAEGPFYDWAWNWIQLSEPEGGHAENPRLLYMDNYRSHLDPAVLKLFRAYNVRVVTFHPHTTHLFCVLDTAVFALFKRKLKSFFDDDELNITMDNIGIYIRQSWEAATVLTTNPLTHVTESAATKGFISAGLVPFSRAIVNSVLDGKHAAIAKLFQEIKAKAAAAGGIVGAPAKSIRLTEAERAAILADFAAQSLEVKGYAVTPYDATKKRPLKALSELATGSAFIASLEKKQLDKVEEEEEKAERKIKRLATAAEKKAATEAKSVENAAAKVAREALVAEKAAAKAALALLKAAPKPKATLVAGLKKPREVEENPYAAVYATKRKK